MKIRNGFVSNSSSSSFIVQYRDIFSEDHKVQLTASEVEKLISDGFKFTWIMHPSKLDVLIGYDDLWVSNGEDDSFSLGLNVVCNQSDIIEELVKLNVSFVASCHYGHETIIFQKDSDHYTVISNPGMEAETYMQRMKYDEIKGGFYSEIIRKVKI